MHSRVDHWLDREDMSGLHETSGLVVGVVRDIRRAMKETADSVATVSTID